MMSNAEPGILPALPRFAQSAALTTELTAGAVTLSAVSKACKRPVPRMRHLAVYLPKCS